MTGPHIHDEDLVAYVLGELEPGPRAELEAHAARCPSCAEGIQRLGLAVEGFRGAPSPEPPARVLLHLLEAQAHLRSATQPRTRWLSVLRAERWRLPVGIAAVATISALLLLGGYEVGQRRAAEPALPATVERAAPEAGTPAPADARVDALPRIAFQTLPPMDISAAVFASRVGDVPAPREEVRDSL